MNYFLLEQDKTCSYAPVPIGADKQVKHSDLEPARANRIPDRMAFSIEDSEHNVFPDVLAKPLLLFSPESKCVLSFFEPQITYKQVNYYNRKSKQHKFYFMPIPESIACLSEKAVLTPHGIDVKAIVLKRSRIKDHCLFRIAGVLTPRYVVRMDLAESLLYRGFCGFNLKKLFYEENV